jgi:hypothetical protein
MTQVRQNAVKNHTTKVAKNLTKTWQILNIWDDSNKSELCPGRRLDLTSVDLLLPFSSKPFISPPVSKPKD